MAKENHIGNCSSSGGVALTLSHLDFIFYPQHLLFNIFQSDHIDDGVNRYCKQLAPSTSCWRCPSASGVDLFEVAGLPGESEHVEEEAVEAAVIQAWKQIVQRTVTR